MINGLDHVNIETTQLDTSLAFYRDVLGLTEGWRPNFGVPGAWLYVDDAPIIHLVQRDEVQTNHTGAINHIALKASGLAKVKANLESLNIPFQEKVVPDLKVTQVFIQDPNKITFELNFYADVNDSTTPEN